MANRLQLESRQERYFGELGRVAASFEPALGDGAAASACTSLMAQAMAPTAAAPRAVLHISAGDPDHTVQP